MAVRFLMVDVYGYYRSKVSDITHKQRILIYGTSDKALNIPEMVKLMKHVVPEFKSQNSRFEEYDK